ncbi:MAG TPA: hypothetical protein DCM00_16965 [Alcanivorax sp.]|nr:hypothetical protein [Alcanivorax sp.]HAJ44309.1 hypothetical protein [Alcanivorax sp.]
MKEVRVSARDLFKGEQAGGMTYDEWAAMDDAGRLKQRLEFIADRAQAMAKTPITAGSRFPANVISQAIELERSAREALRAVECSDAIDAAWYAIDTGKRMGNLNRILTAWDQMQVIVKDRQVKVKGGKNRTGHKSALTIAIEEMVREIPGCSYNDLLRQIDADAKGEESLLYNLREAGRVTIKFVSVTEERIGYQSTDRKKIKRFSITTLNNKLSKAKKAV